MRMRTLVPAVAALTLGAVLIVAYTQKRGDAAEPQVSFAEIFPRTVEKVMPSVVSISTTKTVRRPEFDFFFEDPFDFFGPPFRERPRRPRYREYKQHGLGSGFVIDPRGYIVTNYHVVRDVEAKDIKVSFIGTEKTYVPTAVFRDLNTDVAVIKIDGKNLPALRWGDSSRLRVGEWVMAVGSPLGFGNSVTAGIISATRTRGRVIAGGRRRSLRVTGSPFAVEDYLQTDAAINPGNSGGPLVNLKGEVVGINTLIVSPTRTNAGLGFAIPSETARRVVEHLIKEGKVVRGYLGVQIVNPPDLTDEAAEAFFDEETAARALARFKIKPTDKGALVSDVLEGSPAAKAGVRKGDLIVGAAGRDIATVYELQRTIAALEPGTKTELVVQRQGKRITLRLTVGEQPTGPTAVATLEGSVNAERLGLTVQQITPALARILGLRKAEGVIVTEVAEDGPADKAGLRRNDCILQVGKTEIKTVADFSRALQSTAKDESVVVLVKRRGRAAKWYEIKP